MRSASQTFGWPALAFAVVTLAASSTACAPDTSAPTSPPVRALFDSDSGFIQFPDVRHLYEIVTFPDDWVCYILYEDLEWNTYADDDCGSRTWSPSIEVGSVLILPWYGDPYDIARVDAWSEEGCEGGSGGSGGGSSQQLGVNRRVTMVPGRPLFDCEGGGGGGGGDPEATVTLECTPADPTRGATVTCTAETDVGTLDIEYWGFKAPNLDTIARTSQVADLTWSGPVVLSGTVVIKGSVIQSDATPFEPVSAAINVIARDTTTAAWSWVGKTEIVDNAAADCYDLPHYLSGSAAYIIGRFPSACQEAGWFLYPHHGDGDGGIDLDRVPSGGPDAGLYYVAAIKDSLRIASRRHWDYTTNYGHSVDTTVANGLVSCVNSADTLSGQKSVTWINVTCKANGQYNDYLNYLTDHEHCHMTRAVARFNSGLNVPARMEREVGTDSVTLWNLAKAQLTAAATSIKNHSDSLHSVNTNTTFSLWRRSTTTYPSGKWAFLSYDRYLPTGPTDPNCQ